MRKILTLLLLLFSLPLCAKPVVVDSLRLWTAPDHLRLVFDTSAPVKHTLFSLKNPDRLVVDITNARLAGKLPDVESSHPVIRQLRSARRDGGELRVVVDLKALVKPKSFVLKPNRQYGHRLVVDLYRKEHTASNSKKRAVKSIDQDRLREIVVAIDAGHGGEDSGARGQRGTLEKNVVLQIARKLQALVAKEKGMRPVMIRTGDYYLGLRKRMKLARRERADLFISIHADAFRDSRVRGSSASTPT